jgi:outer membrane receptor protein involved in Fe transport
VLASSASLIAQTVSPPPAADASEKPLVLETFVVNTAKDNGYIAVDSLAGGRTNTPIKLTPSSISSLTRTFIDDLGVQNIRDALKWAPNVVPADVNAGKGFGGAAFQDWAFNYRGAGAGEQGGPGPTRNYFSFFQVQDSYNIERIEFLRGPNSILFGLGTVGGQLSTYTKIPRLDKDFIQTTLSADSNDSTRAEIDLNRRITDSVALRVNAVDDNTHGWRENDVNKTKAVDVALLYKVSNDLTIRAEGEYAKLDRTLISTTIGDKVSGWDNATSSATWGAAPTGSARVSPIQNAGAWGDWLNPFWVYIPSLGSKALMGWAGGYASTSTLADSGQALNFQPYKGWYPAQIKLPWETSYSSTANSPVRTGRDWTYGSGLSHIEYRDLTVSLDYRFNANIDFVASFYRYYDRQSAKDYEGTGGAAIDINKQLPDGTANPNYGKAFADFFLSKQTQSRSVTEARAQLNYHFESSLFGAPWRQLFSVSASSKSLDQSARQYLGQVGNGTTITNPADWVQNMVWGRIYLGQPNQIMNPPEVAPNGRQISYMPKADGYWFDFDDSFKPKDVAFMSQSRFFDDQLALTLGARREKYTEHLRELRRGANLTDRISDESKSADTFSAGGVYYLKSGLGFVANYSKNLQPPHAGSQPYLSGARPDPESGKGYEFGLRYSSGDGKYYINLVRYDTKSVGHLVENPIDLRGVWQKYNIAKGLSSESGNGSLAYSDTTSLDVTGYELEITANPTKNLRLQANFGKPDAKIVDYYPGSRSYVTTNLTEWNSVVNNSSLDTTKRNDLRTAIASVQDKLAQATPGSKNAGLVKYTASFFANYTFTDEMLKGLSAGAGVAYTGKAYAATYDAKEYFGDAVISTDAVIAYDTKLNHIPVRVALNVDNVLGRNDPIVTTYHWGYTDSSGTHIKDGYYYQNARMFRLTARFTF